MSSEKIVDWKGNEVKAGMAIYFVQQKPGIISSGRIGLLMPQTGETIWETEESWNTRKNEDVWELGRPYEIVEVNGNLRMIRHDEDGYSFSFPLVPADNICIKGISDKK